MNKRGTEKTEEIEEEGAMIQVMEKGSLRLGRPVEAFIEQGGEVWIEKTLGSEAS